MPILHDANLYRLHHKINTMFARRKDGRRIATRYDRCPVLFLSACALAATVIHWLHGLTVALRVCSTHRGPLSDPGRTTGHRLPAQ